MYRRSYVINTLVLSHFYVIKIEVNNQESQAVPGGGYPSRQARTSGSLLLLESLFAALMG
jgi:hypothetical protein